MALTTTASTNGTTIILDIQQTIESGNAADRQNIRLQSEVLDVAMVDRMDAMIDHLSHIAARLDAIHKTLQSPLLTQARELFQLGQEHFRKGLLDKALEAYLKAEQKNSRFSSPASDRQTVSLRTR